jgi:23S rRNA (uracil1939-C5)-methyltransferase
MSNSDPITDPSALSADPTSIALGAVPTLRIEKLVAGGLGLSRWGGQIIFCPSTLPGELVRVEIVKGRKGVWYGGRPEILEAHEQRLMPPCPYVGQCGGCQFQHAAYSMQVHQKGLILDEVLRRVGKLPDVSVEPVVPSPDPLGYRHALRMAVGYGNAGCFLGFHAWGTDMVVPIEECRLAVEPLKPVVRGVDDVLRAARIPERTVVQVEFRWSDRQAGCLVILRGFARSEAQTIKLIEAIHRLPSLRGVVYEWLDPADPSQRTYSRKPPLVQGENHLWQTFMGLEVKVGYRSFMQANWKLFEVLGRELIQEIRGSCPPRILELYAGVGPLGMSLAHHGVHVTAVEVNKWAVEDARESVTRNQLRSCRFRPASAESYLKTVQAGQYDAMLLDPPRAGLSQQVIQSLGELKIPRIWYVSCDMATLARDLKALCALGYRVQRVRPYDMFPQTAHLETVVTCISPSATSEEPGGALT